MKRCAVTLLLFLLIIILSHFLLSGTDENPSHALVVIEGPRVVLANTPFSLQITFLDPEGRRDLDREGSIQIRGADPERQKTPGIVTAGEAFTAGRGICGDLVISETGRRRLLIEADGLQTEWAVRVIPGILSLFPPLFSILLALTLRQVIIALFLGLWLGSSILWSYDPLIGLIHALDHYCLTAVADADNAAIILFTLTLGGMVGVISRSGGTRGIVEKLTTYTDHPRGAQLAGWGLGVLSSLTIMPTR